MIKPETYTKCCLNAISVWSLKILPVMFPFFIFTRLIVNLSENKPNFMDKFFNKLYHTPKGSFLTFFLSILSGYPMGAKLICSMYDNNQTDSKNARKMLSFCSVSGPMFMLATVGIGILNSYKAGIIILISNIIASLFNGLIYRDKNDNFKYTPIKKSSNANILSDSVYDALISILMVGAYIVLSFLIIEILKNLGVIYFLALCICKIFKCSQNVNIVQAILCGGIEMTNGILEISKINVSLSLQTIISSVVIAFGGISVLLQSINFLDKLKIPVKTMIKQKTTQAVLCLIIVIPLCIIFL